MARQKDELGVWLGGRKVAVLTRSGKPGHVSSRYTEEALAEWRLNSPVLSCSLPLQERPADATSFFRGLLPEGEALRVLAQKANVVVTDTFGLLSRYGRDVAGALVIGSEAPAISDFAAEPMTTGKLEAAIDDLDLNPLGAIDESELSLAGVQDKILLVRDGSGWARPLYGMPSTHIMKVNDFAHPGLVRAEGQCLDLARSVGLTTVKTEFEVIGDRDCLFVSRYDRETVGDRVERIHQEDVCQAMAIDPMSQRRAKYEDGGGPGFVDVARLLDQYARLPEAELDRLVEVVTFTVLIGNADAHGKNLSFLHEDGEHISLAPLYDTVPTVLWPKLRTEGAMVIGAQPELAEVTLGAIGREAVRWNHPEARALEVAESMIGRVQESLNRGVIPEGSPVTDFVRSRAEQLIAG